MPLYAPQIVSTTPAAGQVVAYDGVAYRNMQAFYQALIPGGIGSTIAERSLVSTAGQAALVSQRLRLDAMYLPKGVTITSLTYGAGTVPLGAGTHQFFGLFDDLAGSSGGAARALLRGTSDDTSTAWAANTLKTLALTSPYTTLRAGLFYSGILVTATTVPTIWGRASLAAATGIAPISNGTSDTGINALPAAAAAITADAFEIFAYAL